MEISVQHIAEEFQALRRYNGDLRLDGVQLKAELVEEAGRGMNLDPIDEPHEVYIENGQVGPIKSSLSLPNKEYIKWTAGIVQDWPRPITFKRPVGPGSVTVRIDHDNYQVVENGNVQVELQSFCGNATSAKASTTRREGAVSFQVRVYPGREFLLEHRGSLRNVSVQTAIRDLKENGRGSVAQLQRDGSKYYWVMEGICKMTNATRHAHEWSN